jgi:hypothetical protein
VRSGKSYDAPVPGMRCLKLESGESCCEFGRVAFREAEELVRLLFGCLVDWGLVLGLVGGLESDSALDLKTEQFRIRFVGTPSQVQPAIDTKAGTTRRFTLRQRISLWFITWGGYLLIRCLGPTLRFTVIREPGCLTPDGWSSPNGIWCFWHRCVIPAGYRYRGKQLAVLISRSFDGAYIARIVASAR